MSSGSNSHDKRQSVNELLLESRKGTYSLLLFLITMTFLSAWLAVSASLARAQEGSVAVSIQISPDSVEVPFNTEATPEAEAQVFVVVTNPTTQTLSNVRLSWLANDDILIKNEIETIEGRAYITPTPVTLPPRSEHAWILRLSLSEAKLISSTVYVHLSYTTRDILTEGSSATVDVPHVLLSSFGVRNVEPLPREQLANVEIRTSVVALNEFDEGEVYAVITNTSDAALFLERVSLMGPSFIEPVEKTWPNKGNEDPLEPRQMRAISLPVKIKESVGIQPGNYLLLVETRLRRNDPTQVENIIATQPVEIQIFGESAILQVLAVPIFLLLPGLLMVVTYKVWRKEPVNNSANETKSGLGLATLGLTILAVFLSLLMAFIIWPIALAAIPDCVNNFLDEHIGKPHNYLIGYRLSDIFYVMGASLLIGFLGFLVRNRVDWWIAKGEASRLKARTPSPDDTPVTILDKLALRGASSWYLPKVSISKDQKSQDVFVFEPGTETKDEFWVVPRGIIHKGRVNPPPTDDTSTELGKALRDAKKVAELAHVLGKRQKLLYSRVDWEKKTDDLIHKPTRVRKSEYEISLPSPTPTAFIEES